MASKRPWTGTLTVPKWTLHDRLWPTVPWLWASDTDEGPRAAWDVEYARDEDRASCWQIPLYEQQKSTCGYLMVHATRGNGNDGGTITLSISWAPRYDVYARDVLHMNSQSHPRRRPVDVDDWREDGA